jgi:hypothetical protein
VSDTRPPYDDDSRGVDETERFSVAKSPSPWYLKRWVLALWGLAVVVLIAAIIYGLAVLARGNGGTTPSTTPSTTEPTTTTTEETIEPSPPSATWTPQHPRHHWWRSNLPPIPPIPHF